MLRIRIESVELTVTASTMEMTIILLELFSCSASALDFFFLLLVRLFGV